MSLRWNDESGEAFATAERFTRSELVNDEEIVAMLILYTRDDCLLCDQAIALLASVRAPDFESVWIDGDAALEARYGERIPVLHDSRSGNELDWPFDVDALRRFVFG